MYIILYVEIMYLFFASTHVAPPPHVLNYATRTKWCAMPDVSSVSNAHQLVRFDLLIVKQIARSHRHRHHGLPLLPLLSGLRRGR